MEPLLYFYTLRKLVDDNRKFQNESKSQTMAITVEM